MFVRLSGWKLYSGIRSLWAKLIRTWKEQYGVKKGRPEKRLQDMEGKSVKLTDFPSNNNQLEQPIDPGGNRQAQDKKIVKTITQLRSNCPKLPPAFYSRGFFFL